MLLFTVVCTFQEPVHDAVESILKSLLHFFFFFFWVHSLFGCEALQKWPAGLKKSATEKWCRAAKKNSPKPECDCWIQKWIKEQEVPQLLLWVMWCHLSAKYRRKHNISKCSIFGGNEFMSIYTKRTKKRHATKKQCAASLKKEAETKVTCFQKYPVGLKYTPSDTQYARNYRRKHCIWIHRRILQTTSRNQSLSTDFKTESELTLKAGDFNKDV